MDKPGHAGKNFSRSSRSGCRRSTLERAIEEGGLTNLSVHFGTKSPQKRARHTKHAARRAALALCTMRLVFALTIAAAAAAVPSGPRPPLSCLLAARGHHTQGSALVKRSEGAAPASAFTDGNLPMPITFEMVALVAVLDLVIYVALPEGERFGPLAQRMPRVAWSVLTIFFSTLTGAGTQPWWTDPRPAPASSAVTDLLWWLPYYAFTSKVGEVLGLLHQRVCNAHAMGPLVLFALCSVLASSRSLRPLLGAFQYLRDGNPSDECAGFAGALGPARGAARRRSASRLRHREMTCTSMVGTGGSSEDERHVDRGVERGRRVGTGGVPRPGRGALGCRAVGLSPRGHKVNLVRRPPQPNFCLPRSPRLGEWGIAGSL